MTSASVFRKSQDMVQFRESLSGKMPQQSLVDAPVDDEQSVPNTKIMVGGRHRFSIEFNVSLKVSFQG